MATQKAVTIGSRAMKPTSSKLGRMTIIAPRKPMAQAV
jgi:hypothetical protein